MLRRDAETAMIAADLSSLAEKARLWMFDVALPLWAEKGIDARDGAPFEALTLDGGGAAPETFKRTRVAGRQLYVFSHAALLGWTPGRAISDRLYHHMATRAWRGPEEGWARRLSPDGEVQDPTPDLYDYAFALFALGWRHKLTGDREPITLAHRTLDLIETRFRHPLGGFLHEAPAPPPRQQNPHMHLIEAALVLAESTGEARFAELADEVRDLFIHRIVRMPDGVLPEFFHEDWSPVAGDKGRWIEPGHQMEWAWILNRHQVLSGADNTIVIRALMTWAERHGRDPQHGWLRNGVRDDGLVLDGGSRAWPNTERIKGHLAMQERFGTDATAAVGESVDTLFRWHLSGAAPGAWQDAYDSSGAPLTPTAPASTLYHVFLAFSELLRIAEERP
jgi:N-acylglucosamine 2-epimerase/mannose-6-phosphate isomerase